MTWYPIITLQDIVGLVVLAVLIPCYLVYGAWRLAAYVWWHLRKKE